MSCVPLAGLRFGKGKKKFSLTQIIEKMPTRMKNGTKKEKKSNSVTGSKEREENGRDREKHQPTGFSEKGLPRPGDGMDLEAPIPGSERGTTTRRHIRKSSSGNPESAGSIGWNFPFREERKPCRS